MTRLRILLLTTLTLLAGMALAQEVGDTVNLRGVIAEDTYAAGGTIFNAASIEGDLVASGGNLLIDGTIGEDALLVSGDLNVTAGIGDDLRAMAGTLVINADVGGDIVIAGGQISIGPSTRVGGKLMAAGGEIVINGQVKGDLYVAGGNIDLSGTVLGNVFLEGGQITLLDGANIAGDLNYSSPQEADIHPQASVGGSIIYTPSEMEETRGEGIFLLATLAVATIVFYLLFPGFSVRSAEVIQTEIWKSLGFGFVVLLVIPFIAVFLVTIVVGLWLGLMLLALYLVSLLIAAILGMVFLSGQLARLIRWEVNHRGRRILLLLASFVIIGLVHWIPVVGGLVAFILLLLGLGAGTIVLFRRYVDSDSSGAI
ncbi:MAG: hypothetical protein HUJ29_08550 [Gammaproteobacteria bacterium]|nr:hypothetical protein [Gammaproteobacteria bacterium]